MTVAAMRYVLSRIAEALGCSSDEDEDLVEAATRLVAEVERLRGDLARCREAQRATAEGWRHEVAEIAGIVGAPAHTAELASCVRAEVERLMRERDEAKEHARLAKMIAARVQAERDEARRDLGAILAVIHRDGGHHTGEHGLSQSVADAHATWAVVVRERDEARAQVKAWQAEELSRRTERDEARAEVEWLRKALRAIAAKRSGL